MADRQFHTYGGMPNRPPDILAPDLVNANADYHDPAFQQQPAMSQYAADGQHQMYDPNYYQQQYYDPNQLHYYYQQPYPVDQHYQEPYQLGDQQQFPDQQQLPSQEQQQLSEEQLQMQGQQHPFQDHLLQQQQQLPGHQQYPEHQSQFSELQHHFQDATQHQPDHQHPQHDLLLEQHHHRHSEPHTMSENSSPVHSNHLRHDDDPEMVPVEHQQREPVDGGNEAVPSAAPVLASASHQDYEDNLQLPMERLVLGESVEAQQLQQQQLQPSAPPPPMFSPMFGPPVTNYPSLPPMMASTVIPSPSGDRFITGESLDQEQRIVTGNEEEPPSQPQRQQHRPPSLERSEAAGCDAVLPPPPPISSNAAMPPPTSSTTSSLPPPPLASSGFQMSPILPPNERSEAVGSDRRDLTVMGPPPKSGLLPPPPARRDVTGSDGISKPKMFLPPSTSSQQQQLPVSSSSSLPVRNLPKSKSKDEYQYDSRRSDTGDEQEEDESVFSQSSEAVQRQQQQQRKGKPQRRDDPSSSDSEERSHNRQNKKSHANTSRVDQTSRNRHDSYNKRESRHHDDRKNYHDSRRHRGDERSFREDRSYREDRAYDRDDRRHYERDDRRHDRDDRSYRDERKHDRDERSVRDDRSYHGGDYRRDKDRDYFGTSRKDRYSMSRPSSRAGHPFMEGDWYGRRMMYPSDVMDASMSMPTFYPYAPLASPYTPAAAHPAAAVDPQVLETFRKNYEYYEQNPKAKETLRLTNPAKYEVLMSYYRSYAHLMPPVQPIAAATLDRPSSRASISSGRTFSQGGIVQAKTAAGNDFNNWNESSINLPESSSTVGMTNFQPTLNEGEEYQNETDAHSGPILAGLDSKASYHEITPFKFSSPHVHGIISPQGLLVKIDAKNPRDGQNATVELHSLQIILSRNNKELKHYPGPLIPGRTHKGEVIQFCQSKISAAKRSNQIVDRDSYILIWELLILLMKQKNTLDGSDIAELLLQDRKDIHSSYSTVAAAKIKPIEKIEKDVDVDDADKDDQEEMESSPTAKAVMTSLEADHAHPLPFEAEIERSTAKFRDHLLFGHKKEALEFAMRHGLWGHALFLASKMDDRTYSSVMLRFANGMAVNDPLQTLYQLMSGRQPTAVKECADLNWGDWRPHLAMILSNADNRSDLYQKSILTLGDTLLEKGLLFGAHFCYIVGNLEFGTYSNRNSKLVLIGSDHHQNFDSFATNEAIQCTEIFEYAQKLNNPDFCMITLVYYKFLYIIRLIDAGRSRSALHYVEELTKMISHNIASVDGDIIDVKSLVSQVLQIAEHLKFLDPMYTTGAGEISEMGDPQWLVSYRTLVDQINAGSHDWSAHQATSHQADSTDAAYQNQSDQQAAADYNQYGQNEFYDPYNQQQPHSDGQNQQQNYQKEDFNQQLYDQVQHQNNETEPQWVGQDNEQGPLLMKPLSATEVSDRAATVGEDPNSGEHSEHHSPVHSSAPPVPTFQLQPAPLSSLPPSLPPVSSMSQSANSGDYFSNIQPKSSNAPLQKMPPAMPKKLDTAAPSGDPNQKKLLDKKKDDKAANGNSKGLFGRLLGTIGIKVSNQAHLPDDKDQSIVWDEKTKRWVDKNASEDEASLSSMAPPSDFELSRNNSTANFNDDVKEKIPLNNNTLAPPLAGASNRYAGGIAKRKGAFGRVDLVKSSQSSPSLAPSAATQQPPPMIMPTLAPIDLPAAMMPDAATLTPEATVNGNGLLTSLEATQQDSMDVYNGQAEMAPVFFNPNQFSAAVPATRRNKYA